MNAKDENALDQLEIGDKRDPFLQSLTVQGYLELCKDDTPKDFSDIYDDEDFDELVMLL